MTEVPWDRLENILGDWEQTQSDLEKEQHSRKLWRIWGAIVVGVLVTSNSVLSIWLFNEAASEREEICEAVYELSESLISAGRGQERTPEEEAQRNRTIEEFRRDLDNRLRDTCSPPERSS